MCGNEIPAHELLRYEGTTICLGCYETRRSRRRLHPAVWWALGCATGSVLMCSLPVQQPDGSFRDWGAVVWGFLTCGFGARAIALVRKAEDPRPRNFAFAAVAIAIGLWRVVFGVGLFDW